MGDRARPGSDGGHRILRIDPATNRITSRATLPARQAPLVFDLQIVDGRPWVLTLRGAIEIDPATGRPGRFVALDPTADEDFPQWTIISGGELWVLTRGAADRPLRPRHGPPEGPRCRCGWRAPGP